MSDALLRAALAGTARDPAPEAPGPLEALAPDGLTPERRLLLLAGAAAAYRRAGRLPGAADAPTPAPPESLPTCSPKAAELIAAAFSSRGTEEMDALLSEACRLLAAAGQILRPALLPAALSSTDAALQRALRPVLGARGAWLSAHRAEWSWALEAAPAETKADEQRRWTEGSPQDRLGFLRSLRSTDPARARSLLEAAFAKEPAEARERLIGALKISLSAADEPFLEGVLDDRAAAVREKAARLLALLPASALGRRHRDRLAPLLQWTKPAAGLLGKLRAALSGEQAALAVVLPADPDESWLRDGVPAKADKGWGQRAFWLARTLALIDPAHWEDRFGASPNELAAAAQGNDDARALLTGLAEATLLFRAQQWAGPLAEAFAALEPGWPDEAAASALDYRLRLLPLLSAPEAAARVQALLANQPQPEALAILQQLSAPWPAEVAEATVAALQRQTRQDDAEGDEPDGARAWNLWQRLGHLAVLRAPASSFDALDQLLAGDSPLNPYRSTLHRRRALHHSIAPEPK